MKRIMLMLFIFLLMTSSIGEAESREVERRQPENSSTIVNYSPTRDGTVSLPPMDVPPMSTSPSTDETNSDTESTFESETEPEVDSEIETEEPPISIPDYSIPGVQTEPSTPPSTEPTPEIEEVEGLEFRMVNRDGMMAFAIIADHEKYELRPVLARGQVPGRSTVKRMSDEFNAIGAVNASYFALNGEILGNTKIDGVVAGTTYYTRSTMGINADGSTFFGLTNYYGNVTMGGQTLSIGGVDSERGADSAVIYNYHQGATTGTNDFGVEYIVVEGIVNEIFVNKGNNHIPQNGYVVSAHGKAANLFSNTKIGDMVTFDESIIDVEGVGSFDEAIHVLGAGPTLVKNGEIHVTVNEENFPSDIRVGRAPRSAVGVTKYGDYILAVVDGRQSHSKGCTLQEWATILLNDFDAINAINLDGGGSTELVVKGDIVNSPSDGYERPVGDALVLIRRNQQNKS